MAMGIGDADCVPGVTVEMYGSAGSGKSTVASLLARGLRGDEGVVVEGPLGGPQQGGSRVYHRLERIGWGLRSALNPGKDRPTGVDVGRWRQQTGRARLSMQLNWWSKRGLLRLATGLPGITVLEEGPIHAIWSAALLGSGPGTKPEVSSEWLLTGPRRIHLFVEVAVEPIVALARLRRREGHEHRLIQMCRRMGPEYCTERMMIAMNAAEGVVRQIAGANPNARVLRVENSREGGVEACALEVAQAVRAAWGSIGKVSPGPWGTYSSSGDTTDIADRGR
jgi:hypothetical protein